MAYQATHRFARISPRKARLDAALIRGLRIDEAMHPLTILAMGMYGRVLPNQNGAPLRLVVPWKYGFKSIKSIVSIQLLENEPPTSWNLSAPREYGFYSNVNPAVDHPRWSQKRERRIGDEGAVEGTKIIHAGTLKVRYTKWNGQSAETVDKARLGRLHILEVQRLIRFMPKIVICVVPGWTAGGGHSLQDALWQERFEVEIGPHPDLTASQKAVVAKDFGMEGGSAILTVRYAMLFYVLKRLALLGDAAKQPARSQHIVVVNWEETEVALEKAEFPV